MPVRTARTSSPVRSSAVEAHKPAARTAATATAANAAQLGEKVRQATRPRTSTGAEQAAARSIVSDSTSAAATLGAGLGRLRQAVVGFHEHGRVACPNPRAVDTKKMASNLRDVVDRELPALSRNIASLRAAPEALRNEALSTAKALYQETQDLSSWLLYYGGASSETDFRHENFGEPLEKLRSFVDELRTAAGRWGGVESKGGVDQLRGVVLGPKFLDRVRADAKMLGAQLAQVPPKASAVAKAETKLLATLEPLLTLLQDTKVMADAQHAIKADFWGNGADVANMADYVRTAMLEVGYTPMGASEHYRGWHSYVVNTMDNLKAQRLSMPIHEQGPSPTSRGSSSWLDDPSIPDWRK